MTELRNSELNQGKPSFSFMTGALSTLVSDVRCLISKVAPRWQKELDIKLGDEGEGTRHFAVLVQEMLLWPFIQSSGATVFGTLTARWKAYLQNRLLKSTSEV